MSRYQAYAEYKDSGVEWLGIYPSHWVLTRVKFESYVKARVGWHGLKSDDFTDEGPYLVTGSDFIGPVINWDNCYHCDQERYEQDPYIQLKEADLLITKDGTIGKVALASGLNGNATLNSGVFVVRPLSNSYTTRYYFWLLKSNVFTGFVDFNKTGSTIVHLYQDTFVNFKYAMPSFAEQEKIANFLDHETAKIDLLIEKQQGLIALLKEKRQAVISHAVTKGLNPNAQMKDSGVEWLGVVPEHWTLKNYRYATKIYRGKFGHRPRNDPALYDGNYPFIQTGDVAQAGKHILNYKQTLNDRGAAVSQKFPAGTLVMAIAANIGDTAILDFEAYAPDSVVGFKPYENLDLEFLRYSLMAALPALEQTSTQSTQANLNIDRIGSVQAAFPLIDEQLEIVSKLDSLIERYGQIEEKALIAIECMQERRTALISAAVTGKIDVRGWQA
ncbi:restriction endonuclease subunit S [Iodobacter fluviatilis]|uniref:Restriction endonuclease subunit S n=1 Tax=Iodobacter fluviatilis TaxID=537 RepID=A0A7G3GD39_9NEIS|nr:restriction endonuclease subunit S [Iodobacter fluviatilis]QBC45510.1 restriction endonuclease subunit S [Iodobacter fluviatilis]